MKSSSSLSTAILAAGFIVTDKLNLVKFHSGTIMQILYLAWICLLLGRTVVGWHTQTKRALIAHWPRLKILTYVLMRLKKLICSSSI